MCAERPSPVHHDWPRFSADAQRMHSSCAFKVSAILVFRGLDHAHSRVEGIATWFFVSELPLQSKIKDLP